MRASTLSPRRHLSEGRLTDKVMALVAATLSTSSFGKEEEGLSSQMISFCSTLSYRRPPAFAASCLAPLPFLFDGRSQSKGTFEAPSGIITHSIHRLLTSLIEGVQRSETFKRIATPPSCVALFHVVTLTPSASVATIRKLSEKKPKKRPQDMQDRVGWLACFPFPHLKCGSLPSVCFSF
jgi:hypothetical protein